MKGIFKFVPAWALAGLMFAFALHARAATGDTALTPDQILQKALARASAPLSHEARPNYAYTRKTVFEDLDTKGHVKDRKEKIFEVSVEGGLTYLKLVELNGQKLTGSELKKENEREAAERQKLTDAKPGKKGDERENFLTPELVAKFQFSLGSEQMLNGRNSYMLSFEPKKNLQVKSLTDRFVNQMAGTVWIDTEDFEIARAEVHLKDEVSLWGGIVGTLRHCRYTLERIRLADGVWFNHSSHGIFEGRKLVEPMFIRTRSDATDFHPVTKTAAVN